MSKQNVDKNNSVQTPTSTSFTVNKWQLYEFCAFNITINLSIYLSRVKPWVIQTFLTFDSTYSVTIHWKAVEQYFSAVLFVFQFYPDCILGNLSILDSALSKVKGLIPGKQDIFLTLSIPLSFYYVSNPTPSDSLVSQGCLSKKTQT